MPRKPKTDGVAPASVVDAPAAPKKKVAKPKSKLPLDERLVLNNWLLSMFDRRDFNDLAGEEMRRPDREGYDDNNVSFFFHYLDGLPGRSSYLTRDVLLQYDENIYRHWKAITEPRTQKTRQPVRLKYFQYLGLLFTEIYLDQLFTDAGKMLDSLNAYLANFNADKSEGDKLPPYTAAQLNKLAFWQATGSGKTLLMHANILQYRHYLKLHRREGSINRIILLTPNEGLSRQHLREFELSGMPAELFNKDGLSMFAGSQVEIIDINKLREDQGEKTVAVDAFERNNLVLVDEGHRGSSGEDWKAKRDKLCERGFSFEYSATFKQAMEAANKPALTEEYAKCILFDYSYKYFYADGYGKDYHILNLADDSQADIRKRYLTASLLAFAQQVRLFKDKREDFRPYLLARPLMVFVGSSVTKSVSTKDVSDVVDILLFLAEFANHDSRREVIQRIDLLLRGNAGLRDSGGQEIFANTFAYLCSLNLTAEQVYDDILLQLVFRSPSAGTLHLEHLKATDGEVALRIGVNEPFGVINVGDPGGLLKLCEAQSSLATGVSEFTRSLFDELEHDNSQITMLVGSRKFTEGWSSWRVSTMGLMNVGQSEGSQIIQLFGRGVRLKGHGFSLKRSHKVQQEEFITPPDRIRVMETLNVFGIRADYMKKFREYLEGEGLPPNTGFEEIRLPTLQTAGLPKLRTIGLKPAADFRRAGPRPTLGLIKGTLAPDPVSVDWYPKIESQRSRDIQHDGSVALKNTATFTAQHLAFMDMDRILFDLQHFKSERGWYNLGITRAGVMAMLADTSWYKLTIPPEAMAFTSFAQVRLWEELAVALLKKYCDVFYKHHKSAYEQPFLEYRDLDVAKDNNIVWEYALTVAVSEESILTRLLHLKDDIAKGTLTEVNANGLHVIPFGRHLYEPLIYLKNSLVKISPVALNEGESDFVVDLRKFCADEPGYFDGRELYLLRNKSRSGIGFFEAGNFYPDFILWLVVGGDQHIAFLDPKGIRNLTGVQDPKISFYRKIKDLEARLADTNIHLSSFIVANTPYREVQHWELGGALMTLSMFEDCHVFFQKDDKGGYIRRIMHRILPPTHCPTPTG